MDINKLVYLPLAIENPPIDALDHLNNIDFARLYQDEYNGMTGSAYTYNQYRVGNTISATVSIRVNQ